MCLKENKKRKENKSFISLNPYGGEGGERILSVDKSNNQCK